MNRVFLKTTYTMHQIITVIIPPKIGNYLKVVLTLLIYPLKTRRCYCMQWYHLYKAIVSHLKRAAETNAIPGSPIH